MPSGGSAAPQSVPTNQSTTSTPWSEQVPYLKQGFQEAQRLYEDPSRPQYYPGQTFANPSQATLQGLAGTEARALQGSPTLALGQNEANNSLAGNYLSAGNPYFSQMADTIRANVLPGIDSRFIQAGRSGSGLHGRAVGEGLGAAIGNLAYQNYGDERNRMGQYAAMSPQFAQADYIDPQMLQAAGAQREAIAQKPISEAVGRWQYEQNLPQAKLADYMQMVGGNFGGTSNTVGQQFYQQPNSTAQGIGTGLSAVAALAPYAAMLLSDERVKEGMEPVGKTYDGDTIYRYRYKWGGPPMFGVSAQEIAKTKPEAVAVHPSGYLAVDYARL